MTRSPAVELLETNPRVFWGKAIQVLIERGWNPPPPDERIVDELLEAMEQWDFRPSAQIDIHLDDIDVGLLTPTEAKVARLVALGGSNDEVAAELGVAFQTVKFHLSNIYRKLGVSSRTQLAIVMTSPRSGDDSI